MRGKTKPTKNVDDEIVMNVSKCKERLASDMFHIWTATLFLAIQPRIISISLLKDPKSKHFEH